MLSLTVINIGAGVRRRGSIQGQSKWHGDLLHNDKQTPATANALKFHRKTVVVDATLLGRQS
jgi:hypothetical protein